MRPGGLVVLLLGAALAAKACEPVPLGDGPRRAAFRATIDELVLPSNEAFEREAAALALACGGVDRAAAQVAWRAARVAYKRVEPFGLGPLVDDRLGAHLDQAPVDPARVVALADTATLTAAGLAELGANRVGFHALEALLFGDAALFEAPRTHRLAGALAELLSADARRLGAAWRNGYAERAKDIGAEGAVFETAGDATDAVVNALVTQVERMMSSRLGPVLGHDSGGALAPERQESPLSDASIDDLLANLEGVELVYEHALSPVVAARSPELDRRVGLAILEARARLLAVPRPLAATLAADPAPVQAAHEALRALWVLLRAEVVGAVGAVLKFNENDGD